LSLPSSSTLAPAVAPARRIAPEGAILRCAGISKRFGGVEALKDVAFAVPKGAIVGLIGPNGAGKTTLFNCVSGFLRPDAGEVWLEDRRVDGQRAQRLARAGVVRTFQSIRMFPGLTVFESLMAAQYARYHAGALAAILRLPRHRREMAEMAEQADDVMTLLGLKEHRNVICERLPLLAQRKVEVARAVLARPRLLLLDEPSAGATRAESEELSAVVRHFHQEGMSILLIEHNVPFVTGLADWIEVLNFGEIVASGSPADVLNNEVVAEIYLGQQA
jgi:branched-chain amino acid transport system ATP-binding protein